MDRLQIIGLTGGIASGKSSVTDILRQLNAFVIDADEVSRELTKEGNSLNIKIKQTFPECVQNGVLNRALLRNLIAKDKNKQELLNSITHSVIFLRIKELIRDREINIVSVPLLFESGFNESCDYVLGVYADEKTRIERMKKRDNIDNETAKKIISLQINQDELKNRCDYVIYNDSGIIELREKVINWWNKIIEDSTKIK